jgi:hypothetical protein
MSRRNKKQPTISLSSTEAEYKSLCSATCKKFWWMKTLEDVGKENKVSTIIKCDNPSSIKLANNLMYHARSKHIKTQHHFVRDNI